MNAGAIRQPICSKTFDLCRFSPIDDERDGFIREIAYRTGCGPLLDVNNVFVSTADPGFSAIDYLRTSRSSASASRDRAFRVCRNKACGPQCV